MNVQLDDEDFKSLAKALRTMHADGRRLEGVVKEAEHAIAGARLAAQKSVSKMRETMDPLADKYNFDPDVMYELDYATKSLVPKRA